MHIAIQFVEIMKALQAPRDHSLVIYGHVLSAHSPFISSPFLMIFKHVCK